jgi:hypothetical protein
VTSNVPSVAHAPSSDEELARWLQESGRRRLQRPADKLDDAEDDSARDRWLPTLVSLLDAGRRPLLLAILALAYLQYFFADVALRIVSLHALIFFVLG